jgi:hypothetical protein
MPKQQTRTVRGFRAQVVMVDTGEVKFTNLKFSSEQLMLNSMRAFGVKRGTHAGIAKVLSYEPHTWEETVYQFNLFTDNLTV